MSRVATISLLCVLAFAAFAIPTTAADSVTITGLPSEKEANGTAASLDFNVNVAVDMGKCASGTSQDFTITLAADVKNVAGNAVTAEVHPASLTFAIPPGATVQAAQTFTLPATLIVNSSGLTSAVAANTTVTATAGTVSCSVPVAEPTFGAAGTASSVVEFKPAGSVNNSQPAEEPVPGLELPVIALAVVVVALVLRRRA